LRREVRNETFGPREEVKFEDHIGEYKQHILEGRRDYETKFIDDPVPALDRYNGVLYTIDSSLRQCLANAIRKSGVQTLILSGAYGAVTASQRIYMYNQPLDLDHWRRYKLPEAVSAFAETFHFNVVIGFFKSPSDSSQYEKIFDDATEISKSKFKKCTFANYRLLVESLSKSVSEMTSVQSGSI